MDPVLIGPLEVRALGRGDPGGPAILLCHGFGAPGDDLVSVARAIDAGSGVRWFFPAGPDKVDVGGGPARAWWTIDIEQMMRERERGAPLPLANQTPPGLVEARTKLEATIAALEASHGVARDKLIVGGFSQGGMLATELALFAEKPFAGLVVMSSTVLSQDRWNAAAKKTAPGIKALVTHGLADPMLPFAGGEAVRDLLRKNGGDVTWVPHRAGHEIPGLVLNEFAAFVRRRFA